MMKNSRFLRTLSYMIQWTWGIPQNLLALFLLGKIKEKQIYPYHWSLVIDYDHSKEKIKFGTFTLGMFIFLSNRDEKNERNLLTHEYGHVMQSLLYGPLFLPIVGYFSYRWSKVYWKNQKEFNDKGVFYTDKFPEKQANQWGEKLLHHPGIHW